MITPRNVFWVIWLVGVLVPFWIWPPYLNSQVNRPFGFALWVWIMLGLLGLMTGGSPFQGW